MAMDRLAALSPEKWAALADNPALYPFPSDARFACETQVSAPLEAVWDFFRRPRNLRELMPAAFGLNVVAGDAETVRAGDNVTYALHVFGVPQRWEAYFPHIWETERGAGFIDIRTGGVFRRWCHIHGFERLPGGGTRILDELRWCLPFMKPVAFAGDFVVERQMRALFRYRAVRLDALFGIVRSST